MRFLFRTAQFEETRTHHRRKREGHEQRDENSHRHGPSERIHVFARITSHERDGQKYNHQRESRGHHRQPNFLGGFDRRANAISSLLFHESENVFEDDDGIVDDDSNG